MKNCKTCGIEITANNAYKYSKRNSIMNICKECLMKQNKINRNKNKEHYANYYKEYWHKRPSIKKKARWIIKDALRSGKIKKLPCIYCGEKRSEAHHFDYNNPLEVIWLCSKHHKILHTNS